MLVRADRCALDQKGRNDDDARPTLEPPPSLPRRQPLLHLAQYQISFFNLALNIGACHLFLVPFFHLAQRRDMDYPPPRQTTLDLHHADRSSVLSKTPPAVHFQHLKRTTPTPISHTHQPNITNCAHSQWLETPGSQQYP